MPPQANYKESLTVTQKEITGKICDQSLLKI